MVENALDWPHRVRSDYEVIVAITLTRGRHVPANRRALVLRTSLNPDASHNIVDCRIIIYCNAMCAMC